MSIPWVPPLYFYMLDGRNRLDGIPQPAVGWKIEIGDQYGITRVDGWTKIKPNPVGRYIITGYDEMGVEKFYTAPIDFPILYPWSAVYDVVSGRSYEQPPVPEDLLEFPPEEEAGFPWWMLVLIGAGVYTASPKAKK